MAETSTVENNFAQASDVDTFIETLARFERGEIDADAWRAFRLVNGAYGQRQEGADSMLRVKIPQGILTADQLEVLASVADRYSRGFCHITTRQNIQMHFVPLSEMGEAMHVLAAAGMTTREACGNSIRNVTTSPTAGIASDEVFDPRPYAEAFTRYFLRHPLSSSLPRKFKVAFSGGGKDHAFAMINDMGYHAKIDTSGKRGFRITVGGGTAIMCQSGRELFDFVPAEDIFAIAEAVVRVFHEKGDREHRKKNRMKFLIKQMGWENWRAAVFEALGRVREEGTRPLPFDPESPPVESEPNAAESSPISRSDIDAILANDHPHGPGIHPKYLPLASDATDRFIASNVTSQKQNGFSVVTVVAPLGDLTSGRLRVLAKLARDLGDGTVRTTIGQNLVLRWVKEERVRELHSLLAHIGLAETDPESIANVGSCPGAESCKLAVTQSRGLAQMVSERFRRETSWVDRAKGLAIRVSGCPNGCGLHHISGIGFQGGLRKVDGRAVPQYFVYVGGDVGTSTANFGRIVGKVPARRLVTVVERLVTLYESKKQNDETITAYLVRASVAELKAAIADLEKLEAADALPEDFVDLGETSAFKPETTDGDCAA